ncbi:MAG: hypothetical protein NTY77_03715 [Elusimicrobia bacterium]|nr:hypothetical protein [Elusimicrobiota bacterium]
MKTSRLLPGFAAAAFLGLTGCAGLRYQPEVPVLPRSAGEPVPLKVGLVVENTNPQMDASGFAAMYVANQSQVDFGRLLADGIRGSHLFEDVRYPMPHTMESLQNADLVFNASFTRSFNADPAKGPKAFLTGFLLFLPVCFIEYDDHYGATGRVTVDDTHGKWVKEYSQTLDLTASWKLFSEGRSYKEGPPTAASGLVAQLVQAMIADRTLFEKLARDKTSRPARKAAPVPAPEEAAAPAQAEAPAQTAPSEGPAAEPAPEPVQPAEKPKPKKPITSNDDQL